MALPMVSCMRRILHAADTACGLGGCRGTAGCCRSTPDLDAHSRSQDPTKGRQFSCILHIITKKILKKSSKRGSKTLAPEHLDVSGHDADLQQQPQCHACRPRVPAEHRHVKDMSHVKLCSWGAMNEIAYMPGGCSASSPTTAWAHNSRTAWLGF